MSEEGSSGGRNPIGNAFMIIFFALGLMLLVSEFWGPIVDTDLGDMSSVLGAYFETLSEPSSKEGAAALAIWIFCGFVGGARARGMRSGAISGVLAMIFGMILILALGSITDTDVEGSLGGFSASLVLGMVGMGFVGAIGGKLSEPIKREKKEIKTWAAEEQWICRNCGAEIPAGKYSCPECGAPVVE